MIEETTATDRDAAASRFEGRLLANLDALYNRARDLTGSAEEAEDLVVETCVRAWRGFSNGGPDRPGKGWLFSILFAIAANEKGSGNRRPEVEAAKELSLSDSDGFSEAVAQAGASRSMNPDFAWTGADVARVVGQLPEELRNPVILVDVDQLTYEDAARVLRCPVNLLRARLFRARRSLFVLLKDCLPVANRSSGAGVS